LDLRHLDFYHTTIPTEIGRLTNLREILFSNSKLRGSIPSELTELHQLRNLELYGNELTGPLPADVAKLSHLRRVDLSYNLFNGSITDLVGIPSLETVHLKRNQFSGTLPSNIGKTINYLSWLDISENRLRGEIPESLGELAYLKHFCLTQNMLQPPIPLALCVKKGGSGSGSSEPMCTGGCPTKPISLSSSSSSSSVSSSGSCDDVACPIGTYSESGQARNDSACQACPDGTGNFYVGSVECHVLSQRELLSMFYTIMDGGTWDPDRAKGWKDSAVAECDWAGVTCDASGRVSSLAFPASAVDYNEDILSGKIAQWK